MFITGHGDKSLRFSNKHQLYQQIFGQINLQIAFSYICQNGQFGWHFIARKYMTTAAIMVILICQITLLEILKSR